MAKGPSKQEKKRLIIFLSLVSAFSIIFGVFYIRHNLRAPFEEQANLRTVSLERKNLEKLAELKTKDSDGDGLWDYDELYQYNTSPYLLDSDSDGFTDKEEIETGNNPNCLAGQVCEQERVDINTNQLATAESIAAEQLLAEGSENMSAAQIREVLLSTGASQAMLDQIDDETLEKLFAETVADNQEGTENTNGYEDLLEADELSEDTFTDLTNLTPAEIRELLIASGADPVALEEIDDETLQAIYLEALAEEKYKIPDSSTDTNNNNTDESF